jgi:hypothetical protein
MPAPITTTLLGLCLLKLNLGSIIAPANAVPVVVMKSRLLIILLSIFRNEIVNFNYNIKVFGEKKDDRRKKYAMGNR